MCGMRKWWGMAALVGSCAMVMAITAQESVTAQEAKAPDTDEAAPKPKRPADVVYVATPHDVVARMLDTVKVTKDDVVYDLGCGDGRFVVTAARKFGCKGQGFDLDANRVKESLENVKKAKVEGRVEIHQEDIFEVDLKPASVITLYLLPRLNQKLIPQLQEMKAGSRIICHDFEIPGMKAEKIFHMTSREDGVEHRILYYTVPLQKED